MMDTQLVLTGFLKRAQRYFPNKQIISRTSPTMTHRIPFKDYVKRTHRLADALTKLGMKRGTKVGTFAWNHHRHLEAYFAIPCSGAILHTINIRLAPEHIIYIINHAEDEILLIDGDLFPLVEPALGHLKTVKHIIVMSDDPVAPSSSFPNVYSYEQLLQEADENFEFPADLEENMQAGMCYTSATTGMPKGVIYTHRSIVLHSLALGLAESFALKESDIALPVVPMFHVNAWGFPFAALNFGANIVLPGPMMTPSLILDLIEQEKVTITAGVPTIWLGALAEQEKQTRDLSTIRLIISGGSASPKGLIQAYNEKLGVPYVNAYGMTETSPLVSMSHPTTEMNSYTDDEMLNIRVTQGLTVSLIETEVINEKGPVPWDGETMGELRVRGPWIVSEYYKDDRTNEAFRDGWLYTGDIAVLTKEGYIKITDRTKDLIKSGGEWISSVDLENALMSHPDVFEAAVIAVPHPKWQERPLACVVLKENAHATKEELLQFIEQDFAKWWLPDDIVFLKEIPKTSVGKFLKAKLREELKDYEVQTS
ncbi:long-chain fatty acid--CoA ligase [Solibacillus merdavium]|uniref:Long-chain fatty acid--CoA ligase n=1 Tax=Solibacillus merdavium TaxID=2762218 RepID=A0ABR8XSW2_9BACL|nr:long-chain fatty acid--CoA ligase [Solibacillus merdavium]MBD8035026.1 long-chain fatty acid--CoA ligase [Solibacillus merdavium]